MDKVLIYCGAHKGDGLVNELNGRSSYGGDGSGDYDKVYVFEANPYLYKILCERFKSDPRINIYNTILTTEHDTYMDFHLIDPNGTNKWYSSTITELGDWNPEYFKISGNTMKQTEIVNLKTTNLHTFCKTEGVDEVFKVITDLEGYDFNILKTLKPMIDDKKIRWIQCEVEPDHQPVKYKNIDNKERSFIKLLGNNYIESWRDNVPSIYFHVDITWRRVDV
jgi:FkbM family methyltransferase